MREVTSTENNLLEAHSFKGLESMAIMANSTATLGEEVVDTIAALESSHLNPEA